MIDPFAWGLAEGDLVLLDSGPLVYRVESGPASRRGAAAEAFFAAARSGRLRLAVSAIAWAELLAGPAASGDEALASRYRLLLADSSLLRVEPVDVAVAERAARLAAPPPRGPGLGLADALHLATALVVGAAAVLTNDEAWRRAPGAPRILLVDELAFDADDSATKLR